MVIPRSVLVLACLLSCVLAIASAAPPQTADEVRALWVTRATLTSPRAITRLVQAACASGFNTLLVQVRARGDAYYASRLEPRAQSLGEQPRAFDPLQQTLAEARQAGLRVHAWISVGLVSSAVELPRSRDHVVYRHPEWLMVPRALAADLRRLNPRSPAYLDRLARALRQQSSEVEGLYLSPVHPGAADYLVRVVTEIVSRYAIDGVHLDYVRYPNDEFDYSQGALERFAATIRDEVPKADWRALQRRMSSDPFALVDRFPERWREFRRRQLTVLVERLRGAVKSRRPAALLTAAVMSDPKDAVASRLQDWQAWAARETVDAVCPMAYSMDADVFASQVAAARHAAGRVPVWAGIGAYRLSADETVENIRTARRLGASGIALFSYDSMIAAEDGGMLAAIGRAAFSTADSRRLP